MNKFCNMLVSEYKIGLLPCLCHVFIYLHPLIIQRSNYSEFTERIITKLIHTIASHWVWSESRDQICIFTPFNYFCTLCLQRLDAVHWVTEGHLDFKTLHENPMVVDIIGWGTGCSSLWQPVSVTEEANGLLRFAGKWPLKRCMSDDRTFKLYAELTTENYSKFKHRRASESAWSKSHDQICKLTTLDYFSIT